MEFRSHIGRARGTGSTGEGVAHWWAQRLSSIALVPLILWFVFSAVGLVGADLVQFKAWIGQHGNALLMILLIIAMYHHAQAGLQVVIEDYVGSEPVKIAGIILVKFAAFLFGGSSVLAVIQLNLGG